MLKIERDIPVPETRGRHAKYPFNEMEIGDSFFVPADDRPIPILQRSIIASAHKLESKFVTRAVDGGVRVWRVE